MYYYIYDFNQILSIKYRNSRKEDNTVPMIPQSTPRMLPTLTCARVCRRRISRLVPTRPEMNMAIIMGMTGLKPNSAPWARRKPMMPPAPAACILTFQKQFRIVQQICMSVAMMITSRMSPLAWSPCRILTSTT